MAKERDTGTSAKARGHIASLVGAGWPMAAVARAAKCSTSAVERLMRGGSGSPGLPEALLAVDEAALRAANDEWPSAEAHKRLKALIARGWRVADIAEACGATVAAVKKVSGKRGEGGRCSASLCRAVAALPDDPPVPDGMVDAAPVRDRVLALRGRGWSLRELSERCGAEEGWLDRLVRPVPPRTVSAEQAALVLSVPADEDPLGRWRVPAAAVRGHVEGLVQSGWSVPALARRADVPEEWLRRLLREDRASVRAAYASKVMGVSPMDELLPLALPTVEDGACRWTVQERNLALRVVSLCASLGYSDRVAVAAVMEACGKGAAEATRAVAELRVA